MKTILIADDDRDIRAVIRMRLENERYRILEAANGHSAVELSKAERPDLLFLDLAMPDMSGIEVLRILRDDASTAEIPVIILSGSDQTDDQRLAQSLGVRAYVMKPVDGKELLNRVWEILH